MTSRMGRAWPAMASLSGLLAVAACAAQPAAPPPPAPAPALSGSSVGTPSSFDGTYTGALGAPAQRSGGSGRITCRAVDRAGLRVTNGVASMRFDGLFTGPVGADGSLSISGSNGGSLVGQFTGTTFTGTVNSPNCSYAIPLFTKG